MGHDSLRSSAIMFFPTLVVIFGALSTVCAAHTDFLACLPTGIPCLTSTSSEYESTVSKSFVTDRSRPQFVILARFEYDVRQAVRCAAAAGLGVCARSGGHSFLGASLCAGVMVDMAAFNEVRLVGKHEAQVGPSATLGGLLYGLWTAGRQWFATGVCPGVGVGGYLLCGGHGPYEGLLGLGCDYVLSMRLVNRFGGIRTVSRSEKPNLFWAMCGAGGGQFGIVTSFRLQTNDSAPFDNSVGFRFGWPLASAGEVLSKWATWDQAGGRVWGRMDIRQSDDEGFTVYGACYDVHSTEECLTVLRKAAFFTVPNRETVFLHRMTRAIDYAAFLGPDGDWANRLAPDTRAGLIGKRYIDAGGANDRVYQSTFLKMRGTVNGFPNASYWQSYAELCARPGKDSIPWSLCELSVFNGALNKNRDNAFAFRSADIITHYIVGGGTTADKSCVYLRLKNYLRKYTIGVYVNYPEFQLGKHEYPKLYWGKSLPRLSRIKTRVDPDGLFSNPQPIPML